MDPSEPTTPSRIILCDRVIREADTGKLSLIGVFEGFSLPQTPFMVPPFVVTAAFTNISDDPPEMRLTVRLEDPKSGLVLGNASITLNKQHPEARLTRDQIIEFPFPFDGVVFPATGRYEAIALFNNQVVGTVPFLVSPITVQSKPPV